MLAAVKSSLCACQRRADMQARILSEARLAPAFFCHDTGSNGTTTGRIVLATPHSPLTGASQIAHRNSSLGWGLDANEG